VYTKRGEYESALVDFAAAAGLQPGNERLFLSRGHAYFLKGDYRAAQSDFRHVAEKASAEQQLHALIWLYLASQRLGEDGRSIVSAIRSHADLSSWPGPAVMLFLGEATPEAMLARAWSFDSKTGLLQRCEAYFFLGQYYLLAGNREAARAAFSESFATGVKTYLEFAYSRLELKRLGESIADEHSRK
jgi:lipoprotein NlpI